MHSDTPTPGSFHGALDWKALGAKLRNSKGRQYWRSLEELAGSPQFLEIIHREFPQGEPGLLDAVSRRGFMKLMAASLALAGLTGCSSKPTENILPYSRAPEDIVPGKPLYFATAMTLAGSAMGLLVETHEGRPTKIEGNPGHPASLGATDVFAQASLLTLYDPDRSGAVTYLGDIRPWPSLLGRIQDLLSAQSPRHGAGMRLLTETVVSPTLAAQIRELLGAFPEARWHQYEPVSGDNGREGARLVFGRPVNTVYNLDKAAVVVSLDADFLTSGPASVRLARQFASKRRPRPDNAAMARLCVVEPTPTSTGVKADHRLALAASQIEPFAEQLAGIIQNGPNSPVAEPHGNWLRAMAQDLLAHRGAGVVIAGQHQTARVHAWAHTINHALGNAGSTVSYTEPIEADPVSEIDSLRSLTEDMDRGEVEWLVILSGNPVYDAPADLGFGEKLLKVPLRMHFSLYADETSALCQWHIPEAHYLEAWGDTRAFDGTASIVQPVIAPLYDGKPAHEFLAAFTKRPERSDYEIVREYWQTREPGADFETFWRQSLNSGVIEGTSLSPINVTPSHEWQSAASTTGSATSRAAAGGYEILFRPDPGLFDGRFANNGWLQELPKPITRLTWDNAALISPAMAEQLALTHRIDSTGGEHGQVAVDIVEISVGGRSLRAPAWVVPGQADHTITLHLGYGRTRSGRVGNGTGFNAYPLRTTVSPGSIAGATMRKLDEQFSLACVQFHHAMEGRDLIHAATLEGYRANPAVGRVATEQFSLYPGFSYKDYAWGMTIDLNSCVGCNACVVACQAENNIPVVGKTEVMRGREMHWIRIDHYQRGALNNPERHFQPVPCMQCENAPCELVCPVGATVHSAEGLNDMVYNRCVGTRYCSNNCPYKVRRFNFLQYSDWETPSLKLLHNPDVTVRSRGVMEKCTYCVQRINHGRIEAEEQNRRVRDGEIRTACQQVCPAEAIVFGNINDPQSRVAKLKADPRNYSLLEELNTRPRTTYLAAVSNPNPTIPAPKEQDDEDEHGE